MFKVEVDKNLLEQAVKIAAQADVIPIEEYPGNGVKFADYITYDALSAEELGVHFMKRTPEGKPMWHPISDIRIEEHEEYEIAILTPLIKAAIEYYLKKLAEVAV